MDRKGHNNMFSAVGTAKLAGMLNNPIITSETIEGVVLGATALSLLGWLCPDYLPIYVAGQTATTTVIATEPEWKVKNAGCSVEQTIVSEDCSKSRRRTRAFVITSSLLGMAYLMYTSRK